MQLPRVVSLFLVFFTFGLLASSTAVKRQNLADVTSILSELQTSTGAILPQISSLGTSGQATQENIAPLVSQLTSSLTTAQSALSLLPTGQSVATASEVQEVAVVLAGVITEIVEALDTLVVLGLIPALEVLLASLEVALQEVLTSVEALVTGVLVVVVGLLTPVLALLSVVGLGGLLGILGLGIL